MFKTPKIHNAQNVKTQKVQNTKCQSPKRPKYAPKKFFYHIIFKYFPPALFTNWETDEKYHWPHQPSTTQGVRYGPLINYTLDWEKIVEPPSC